MPRVSVVIPIYNVEKYLKNCLDQVLSQKFRDFEVILVNDGSTDGSLEICRTYRKKDKKIRLITKKNGGLSSARNAGIDKAQGKYIVFIDPDDRIMDDYLSVLYQTVEKKRCQIVISGYETIPDHQQIMPGYKWHTVMSGRELLLSGEHIHSHNDLCFVWRNIYKLSLIKERNIRFNEQVFIGEDVIFNLEYLLCAKRAYALPEKLYEYTTSNPDSLMRKPYKPNLESSLKIQYGIRKALSYDYGLMEHLAYRKDLANYYIDVIYPMVIENLRRKPEELRQDLERELERIMSYGMFRDNIKILGFRHKCTNWKEYIYYLLLKYQALKPIKRFYEREWSVCE